MAIAIRFDRGLTSGRFTTQADLSQADLSRAGRVTEARLTQILKLTSLAPDIQEHLLLLEPYATGRAPLTERQVRSIATEPN